MAVTTAQDLINKAFHKIGVLAYGETSNSTWSNNALDTLNVMLDSWAGRTLLTTAQIRENFTLTANQANYTIGSTGANFTTTKPFEITGAFIRDSSNYDYHMDIVSRDIYDAYGSKALAGSTSRPTNIFYDPGATQQANQVGTIYLFPIPDAAYTLYIESEKPFTSFANLTDTITFPPSYVRAIIYNLAVELAPDFGFPVTPEIMSTAQESMRIIQNVNSRNKKGVVGFDFPGKQGSYNINSDEY